MLRATIALLLTVTTVQAGEITLACEGTKAPFFRYAKPEHVTETLVVDTENESVTWVHYGRAGFDPAFTGNDKHVAYFKWEYSKNCDDPSPMPERTPPGKPLCDSYSFTGSIDRVTGVASILHSHVRFGSWADIKRPESDNTMSYDLRCKPAQPLF
jgi:hypothetical protein